MNGIERHEFDGVKTDLGKLATDVEVMKGDLETLKQNEHDAKDERKGIHDKLEEILKTVNQRIGGDRVRATLHKWGWDSAKVLAGGVVGWIIKVLAGS